MDALIINVKKVRKGSKIPRKATDGSKGFDVYASAILDKETRQKCRGFPIEINPGTSVLFGIGVSMEVPKSLPVTIASRSSFAIKYDIEVGCPGAPCPDSDYRDEVMVLLRNLGQNGFVVDKNMRIAQMVFHTDKTVVLKEVKNLPPIKRGHKGLGSTGLY